MWAEKSAPSTNNISEREGGRGREKQRNITWSEWNERKNERKIIYYITRWSWKIRRPCCQYNVTPCRNGGMDGQRKWEFQTHKMWNQPHLMWSKAIKKMMRLYFHSVRSVCVAAFFPRFGMFVYMCGQCSIYFFYYFFELHSQKTVKEKKSDSSRVELSPSANPHACVDVELRVQSNICASWFKKVATSFV